MAHRMPAPRRCALGGTPRELCLLIHFACLVDCVAAASVGTVCHTFFHCYGRSDCSGAAARRPCECENQPIDPTCGMSAFPPVPASMLPCSPPVCKVQGPDPKTPCNPDKCTFTSCKKSSPSPTPAAACLAALNRSCGDAEERGPVRCGLCVDLHSQQLSKAGCTKVQREKFCGE